HSVTDLARILYLACSLIALHPEHTVIFSAQSGGNTEHLTDLSGTILSKELFWRGQKVSTVLYHTIRVGVTVVTACWTVIPVLWENVWTYAAAVIGLDHTQPVTVITEYVRLLVAWATWVLSAYLPAALTVDHQAMSAI
ncbi:hypothetical protein RRG08_049805, partial [Elysia crispata]